LKKRSGANTNSLLIKSFSSILKLSLVAALLIFAVGVIVYAGDVVIDAGKLDVSSNLYVDANGNVGIGTTNPSFLLQIEKNGVDGRSVNLSSVLFVNGSNHNVTIGTLESNANLNLIAPLSIQGIPTQGLSLPNQGRIYYDLAENKFKVSENNGAYVNLVGAGGGGGGGFSATGGTVTTVGGFQIHTFTSSGTLTIADRSGSVEVLVVAGGGAGGGALIFQSGGGGGGAGGLIYNPSYAVTSGQVITVIVGAGGSGSTGTGGDGSNSVFGTLTAIGGGGGAASLFGNHNGRNGGSGGGCSGRPEEGCSGGSGTSGQGTSGGTGIQAAIEYGGGGGGGAGTVGGDGSASAGGNGGAGLANSISGTSTYYAGGGGGGTYTTAGAAGAGGNGGGGAGNRNANGVAGTANTGGGGGGVGAGPNSGGSGGSGIVIVRYPLASGAGGGGGGSNPLGQYRKPVAITNSGSALTNYQTLVTADTASLILAGKMKNDCGDIRFTDTDGSTQLNYWIESGCNTANTKIWVKVPSIPASSFQAPVSYWKMDEISGSTVADSVGTNTGTATGTTIGAGKSGNARSFNGVSEYISISDSNVLGLTNAATLSAWIKRTSSGTSDTIISKYDSSISSTSFFFDISSSNNPQCRFASDLNNFIQKTATVSITDTNWHLITCTLNSGAMRLYVDGVESSIADQNAGSFTNIQTNSKAVEIGRLTDQSGSTGPYMFGGTIDEVSIYNTALTPIQITNLYNSVTVPLGSKNIYMHYGQPTATTTSNGDTTFELFDDFNGASLDASKWNIVDGATVTVSSGIANVRSTSAAGVIMGIKSITSYGTDTAIRTNYKLGPSYSLFGYADFGSGGLNVNPSYWRWDAATTPTLYSGASTTTGEANPVNTQYYTWDLMRNGATNLKSFRDGANSMTLATVVSDAKPVGFSPYSIGTVNVDWVLVRKYSSPEPAISVGVEEAVGGGGGSNGWTEDAGSNKIYTTNNGRSVGIGTTTPAAKLEVFGGDIQLTDNGANSGRLLLKRNTGNGDNYILFGSNAGGSGYDGLIFSNSNGFNINTNGGTASNILLIGGNVGIGTTTPAQKLEVTGNIKLSGATPTYVIKNVAIPVDDSDVATKGYVNAQVGGVRSYLTTAATCSDGSKGIRILYSAATCSFTCSPCTTPSGWYLPTDPPPTCTYYSTVDSGCNNPNICTAGAAKRQCIE